MNTLHIQDLHDKLQKHASRFNYADEADTFHFKLIHFWHFFEHQPVFMGIVEELLVQFPNIEGNVDQIFKGKFESTKTEEEAAAIGYSVLRRSVKVGQSA